MPERSDKGKRPRDPNQLAKWIIDRASGELPDAEKDTGKNPHAAALGRLGGLKGGKARAENLSRAKLSAIGRKGARARWGKKKN